MTSFYDAVGGDATFRALVHGFYEQVKTDDILGPMYPAEDLEGAEDRLRWFLAQYWGGPEEFNEKRGHPRLRMRHAPFKIGPAERDAWLRCMRIAVDEADLAPEHRDKLWQYLEMAADSLVNSWF